VGTVPPSRVVVDPTPVSIAVRHGLLDRERLP
jgi:hypothetical protein